MKALTMKKLVLAPAVALAFTGLVAAPVAAAETPSTQSDSALTKAEQAKKVKADKLAKEKKLAEEKAEQEKKDKAEKEAAEAEAAKKAAEEEEAAKKAKDKKSGAAEDSAKKPTSPADDDNKPDPKPKDNGGDDEATDEVEKLNASVNTASSISAENLAERGLDVTIANLEKGDEIRVNGDGLSAESTTAASGTATLTLRADKPAEDIDEGVKSLSIQVTRTTQPSEAQTQSLNETVEVTPFAADPDPEIALSETEISESDFNKDGITVAGTGFTLNGDVKINVGAGNSFFQDETVTADENGEIEVPITAPDGGLAPGPYTVTVTDVTSDAETKQSFTVTEDSVVPIDASLTVDPEEITAEDLSNKDKGVTVTV
ncbi:MAG: hypothetical protein L0H69_09535, partial [Brevibacterium sp.]|nr:hypothetical protein [Brevibacterium sp.]